MWESKWDFVISLIPHYWYNLRDDLEAAYATWIQSTLESLLSGSRDIMKSLETACHHALEHYEKDWRLHRIWKCDWGLLTAGKPEPLSGRELESLCPCDGYQWALDHLEGLIVAWMFELTKMNMSQLVHNNLLHRCLSVVFKVGVGKPVVFPKQVSWVWVQFWFLAHCNTAHTCVVVSRGILLMLQYITYTIYYLLLHTILM